ncbi:MAG: 2-phosphosulfolactate phosphatase [candidate division WOR-3 bacterium]
MILNLYSSPQEIEDKEIFRDKSVLFLDAFQSSPLFLSALLCGAKAIIPTLDVEMAIKVFKSSYSNKDGLLIGERDYEKIEGFHYGTNFLAVAKEIWEGKSIIYYEPYSCSSLLLTEAAKRVYIGSFLNRTKVCEKLKDWEEVQIITVGLKGRRPALENILLAGSIIEKLSYKGLEMNDSAQIAFAAFRNLRRRLKSTLFSTERAVALIARDRKEEIEKSIQVDAIPLLPVFSENRIVLSEE